MRIQPQPCPAAAAGARDNKPAVRSLSGAGFPSRNSTVFLDFFLFFNDLLPSGTFSKRWCDSGEDFPFRASLSYIPTIHVPDGSAFDMDAMLCTLIILSLLMGVPAFAVGPADRAPTHSQIMKWWKPGDTYKPDEAMEIGDVQLVRLVNGEKAFAGSVTFPYRGYCCNAGILLIRPVLQEAREIRLLNLAGVDEVTDIDRDGISEVVTSASFGRHGFSGGEKTILHFDGWRPIVLHKQSFGDNFGDCGKEFERGPCESKEVKWFFLDLDGDRKSDLVEVLIFGEGEEPDRLKWALGVNFYLLKNGKFVSAKANLKMPKTEKSPRESDSRPAGHGGPSVGDNPTERQRLSKSPQPSDESAIEKHRRSTGFWPAMDEALFLNEIPPVLDRAATSVRDILSQFGITPGTDPAESDAHGVPKGSPTTHGR